MDHSLIVCFGQLQIVSKFPSFNEIDEHKVDFFARINGAILTELHPCDPLLQKVYRFASPVSK